MKLDDIPMLSTAPANAEPSPMRRLFDTRHASRRGVLKGIVGAAMALGIGALELLPVRAAQADDTQPQWLRGRRPWNWWNRCRNYSRRNGRREAWRWCNPNGSARVARKFCSPKYNRHRVDAARGRCFTEDYHYAFRCYNLWDTVKHVNAWLWRRGEDRGNKPSVVCSDGKTIFRDRCRGRRGSYNSACKKPLYT